MRIIIFWVLSWGDPYIRKLQSIQALNSRMLDDFENPDP